MEYLTKTMRAKIARYSLSDPYKESCGLILREGRKYIATSSKNISPVPEDSFAIPHSILHWAMSRQKLVAIWHSHPQPCEIGLSELDKLISEKLKVDCVAYDMERREFMVHSPVGYEVPYVGRPFVVGVFDCWSLVRDWFSREKNIHLEDITHECRDVGTGMQFLRMVAKRDAENIFSFQSHLEARGFRSMPLAQAAHGDVFLMTYENIKSPLHVALYLGGQRVLHHPENALSLEEHYGHSLKKSTVGCMRHNLS